MLVKDEYSTETQIHVDVKSETFESNTKLRIKSDQSAVKREKPNIGKVKNESGSSRFNNQQNRNSGWTNGKQLICSLKILKISQTSKS